VRTWQDEAGFATVKIEAEEHGHSLVDASAPGLERGRFVATAKITTAKRADTLVEDSCPCKPMR
jgi:hypothetical protein